MEDFTWTAHYRDGADLPEVGPDGAVRGFAEVDLSRLAAFALTPNRTSLPASLLRLADPTSQPIYFRRRTIRDVLAGSENISTVTVLGFRRGGVAAYVALYPDGTLLVSDRDDL